MKELDIEKYLDELWDKLDKDYPNFIQEAIDNKESFVINGHKYEHTDEEIIELFERRKHEIIARIVEGVEARFKDGTFNERLEERIAELNKEIAKKKKILGELE